MAVTKEKQHEKGVFDMGILAALLAPLFVLELPFTFVQAIFEPFINLFKNLFM